MEMRERLLMRRQVFVCTLEASKNLALYYAAKLTNTFGIIVDNPELVTAEHVQLAAETYGIEVPNSFYSNPQDIKHYTCEELKLNQVLAYMTTYGEKEDPKGSQLTDMFTKILPDYAEGEEVEFRKYRILTERKARNELRAIATYLASYTRPWSETEEADFRWLYDNGCVLGQTIIKGKDNAINMYKSYPVVLFARSLDVKDVVKLSIDLVGEQKHFLYTPEQSAFVSIALQNARQVPLTKRQAKYASTIARKVGLNASFTNEHSPHKQVTRLMKQKQPVKAAAVYAKHGSLLTRNLVWLLSRSNINQAKEILSMVQIKSPLAAMQLINGLSIDQTKQRVFGFYRKGLYVKHKESPYEYKHRKSRLSSQLAAELPAIMEQMIDDYYRAQPRLGTIYIEDNFKKIAVPMNTSGDAAGIGVLPKGSRVPIKHDFIRTFCFWSGARDVDTSLMFIKDNGEQERMYFGNYSNMNMGQDALMSGDDTSSYGSEYYDLKIALLRQRGYRYVLYIMNGFGCRLNEGQIFCGYQNKKDLNTKVWDPKNIALKLKVHAATRTYVGFAIDLESKEVIVLNHPMKSNSHLMMQDDLNAVTRYLSEDYMKQFNAYHLASLRGVLVDDPIKADVVFSDDYTPLDNQSLIKSTDIDKMVAMLI